MNPFINLTIESTDKPVVETEDDEDGFVCIYLSSGIRLIGPPQLMLTYVQELASAVALKVHA